MQLNVGTWELFRTFKGCGGRRDFDAFTTTRDFSVKNFQVCEGHYLEKGVKDKIL